MSPREQETFQQLSIFRGGFSREAAQQVANYIQGMTNEAVILAKAAGKTKLTSLEREDLRSLTLEACAMTGIPLIGSNYTFGEMFGFC